LYGKEFQSTCDGKNARAQTGAAQKRDSRIRRAFASSWRAPTNQGEAISIFTHPTTIAEPVPKRKRGIWLLAMTGRGRAFSSREGGYSRLAGAGFGGGGCMGDEAARQEGCCTALKSVDDA